MNLIRFLSIELDDDLLERLEFVRCLKDSRISMTKAELNFVDQLFDDTRVKAEIIYRRSEEEFSAEKFHEKCDRKSPTLTTSFI